MSSDKIISFQEEKERIELKNRQYKGSVTICVEGNSFENATYYYYLEYIEEKDLEHFFKITLNSLIDDFINENGTSKIQEPIEPLLNKEITIDYYYSKYNNNKFFFEYAPEDITKAQLIVILNSSIANLRQK